MPGNREDKIKVMIVDDSLVVRAKIADILRSDPNIELVASLSNATAAISNLKKQPVDIILLDIEMSELTGLQALPLILQIDPSVIIIMVSSLTARDAEISVKALSMGAADYLLKPSAKGGENNEQNFRTSLLNKINQLGKERQSKLCHLAATNVKGSSAQEATKDLINSYSRSSNKILSRPDIIAIGCSTGGPQALLKLLTNFDSAVSQPIFITQHMPPTFTKIMAEQLARISGRKAKEAEDLAKIEQNTIYVAPGDYHLTVEKQLGQTNCIRLLQTPFENFCRPSVDPMLRSLAEVYGRKVLCVILTGMGQDGAAGAKVVVANGGIVIAQDEQTSVVWGMPGAVAKAGVCNLVGSIEQLRSFIINQAG